MYELQLKIANLCVESGLPLEAIYYVLGDLYKDVTFDFLQARKKMLGKVKESEDNGDITTEMAVQ